MIRLFESDGPRLYGLPPGANFAHAFADGLLRRLGDAPREDLARVRVVMNTRRAVRAVSEAFEASGDAVFLPRIEVLDAFARGLGEGPPPVEPLTRRLILTKAVAALLDQRPTLGESAAAPLAASLISLLDEMARERAPLSRLDGALGDDASRFAAHWSETLEFLKVIREFWPAHCEGALGAVDPGARRVADVDALLANWRAAPVEGPIIAAGSTGSQRLTADLLVAIAGAPQGAVVFPGFDFEMDEAAWKAAGPDHPQFGFKNLLERLDLSPDRVERWRPEASGPRARLMTEALRPAPVTDHWRDAAPALEARIEEATGGLTIVEAETPRREAEAIAVEMRRALESGLTAALVTPDRTLARRVAGALSRWGVEPDDSSGRPLRLTPPGVFLTMLADMVCGPFDPTRLLAVLKHPLAERGGGVGEAVARMETRGLRNRNIRRKLGSIDDLLDCEISDPPEPLIAPALGLGLEALRVWEAGLRPLGEMIEDFVARAGTVGADALWEKAAGGAAREALEAFLRAAEAYGPATPADFPLLLSAALEQGGDVREDPWRADPRLRILGALEARAQSYDVMILGGLNEGGWPQAAPMDPWLSRPMRAEIGLNPPERRIGLSAHDFMQAASAPRAVLTRALKAGGAPTTPSRWLSRLTTLMSGLKGGAPLERAQARGAETLALVDALSPAPPRTPDGRRPAPDPPGAARPRRLSVTEISTLIRDPYSIYARRVLGLRPLEEPAAPPDARLRGEVVHAVVERFVRETMSGALPPPPDQEALFDRLVAEEIASARLPAVVAAAWRARLLRARDRFLAEEAARRAEARPIAVEPKGLLTLSTPRGSFELSGRADRIDRAADGGLMIYDYKTGAAPTAKQTAIFEKQLPLLAAIAAAGGFEAVAAAEACGLGYVSFDPAKATPTRMVDLEPDAADRLRDLIIAWEEEGRAYVPRAYPEAIVYESDYDHLSRFGEWEDRPAGTAPVSLTSGGGGG